jgi:alpha-D-ribose 1-methylphosphonate 5-triphosphate synthase subunit PhnL
MMYNASLEWRLINKCAMVIHNVLKTANGHTKDIKKLATMCDELVASIRNGELDTSIVEYDKEMIDLYMAELEELIRLGMGARTMGFVAAVGKVVPSLHLCDIKYIRETANDHDKEDTVFTYNMACDILGHAIDSV